MAEIVRPDPPRDVFSPNVELADARWRRVMADLHLALARYSETEGRLALQRAIAELER